MDLSALNNTPSIDENFSFVLVTLIFRLPQLEKQLTPREVRVEGRVMEAREEQPKKH